ncbi:STM4012 family radical SAM protein [Aquimarina longa]|uniref:STM4012 family radical SAM protein n=1 Tax=Aquimarina longa TaxID=1080221 RepID=UPI0007863256|nr:STM4012 family radical SAM protein [Aquimarina longa]
MIVAPELDTITQNLYQGYTYSYPHKSTYRNFEKISLEEVWEQENRKRLFFYTHIPFCEMRCGFCNLFTIANPKEGVKAYIDALRREMETYKELFDDAIFTNFAIGGGTPTFLEPDELELLLRYIKNMGVDMHMYYGSIEASPKTLTKEKIKLIEEYGITRLSMGVQSWIEDETKALGRPQSIRQTTAKVTQLALSAIPEFNLDLIYGAENQTKDSFLYSIEKTVEFQPTEIFLYPLYVRQLTGLGKRNIEKNDHRQELYLIGRDALLNSGYEQTSMRCFRKKNTSISTITDQYDSVLDGMIGIGAGARSYTQQLHYSTDYAVDRKVIKNIISNYTNTNDFKTISYGIRLSKWEQKTRFVIKSITDGGCLSPDKYQHRFGANVFEEFELLNILQEKEWLIQEGDIYKLSQQGMCYEDAIGPVLYTDNVKSLMEEYTWK